MRFCVGHGTRSIGPDYIVNPETGCWEWQKNLRMGYGRAWRGGKLVSAHIWYWEQENGPVPEGMDLDHLCHNADLDCAGGTECKHRRCVNPAHLEPARRTANVRRGRQTKLTQADVDAIRAAPMHWGAIPKLAEKYGVSRVAISKLRARAYWPD